MRNAFADEITALAAADPRLVLLSGDIGNKLFDRFKAQCPERFLNCGVAEANMIGMAAGLALSGLRPVSYTITPFTTSRCLEQIRVDVCYHEAPAVIVGVGAGLAYASLGPTHHACEDIALLRALPNMTVVCPGDAWEVRAALRVALAYDRPLYLRLGKKGEPTVHCQVPEEFVIGRGLVLRRGSDACLLSTGNMLSVALSAADELARQGISAQVVSLHTVKPLDEELLADVLDRCRVVATIEEHSLIGGLGSAVAEWAVDQGPFAARLLRLGTADRFLHESTEQAAAREQFGLTALAIARRVAGACHQSRQNRGSQAA